jgi:hypothetical protein
MEPSCNSEAISGKTLRVLWDLNSFLLLPLPHLLLLFTITLKLPLECSEDSLLSSVSGDCLNLHIILTSPHHVCYGISI